MPVIATGNKAVKTVEIAKNIETARTSKNTEDGGSGEYQGNFV